MSDITIFTSKTCAYCPMVKRFLDFKNVTYKEIDIDEHPELYPNGYTTVPLTRIGERIIAGYSTSVLSQALTA